MSSASRRSRGSRSQHRLVRPWRSRWRRARCRKGFRQREGCGQGHFSRSSQTCSSRSVGDWRRPKWTGRVYIESIVSSKRRWKYRVALDSIAGRYSAQLMHAFDSEQVLGKQGCRSLSSCCSERTTWPSGSELSTPPRPQWIRTMKQLLIAVTLVAAFAAPAMAENFSNPYVVTMGR